MSVAFWDAVMLREELAAAGADLRNRRALQMALCAWHRRRLGLASTVNTLSWCLYTLFAAPKGPTPFSSGAIAFITDDHSVH